MIFSKKGQLGAEVLWVIIILVAVAITWIVIYPSFSELNDDIQSDMGMSQEAKNIAEQTAGNYPSNMDGVFFFLFFLLWAFLVFVAFFANTHPVFMILTIIMAVVALVMAMFLANAYQEVVQTEDIAPYVDEFPKTHWIMKNLLMIGIFMAFSVMSVLYARTRG